MNLLFKSNTTVCCRTLLALGLFLISKCASEELFYGLSYIVTSKLDLSLQIFMLKVANIPKEPILTCWVISTLTTVPLLIQNVALIHALISNHLLNLIDLSMIELYVFSVDEFQQFAIVDLF